jgi:ABC-type uncharacterized transport system permease subunit
MDMILQPLMSVTKRRCGWIEKKSRILEFFASKMENIMLVSITIRIAGAS